MILGGIIGKHKVTYSPQSSGKLTFVCKSRQNEHPKYPPGYELAHKTHKKYVLVFSKTWTKAGETDLEFEKKSRLFSSGS